MSSRIAAIIAVCDLITPLQHFEQLRAQGWSATQARAESVEFARGIHCTVREIACTDESAAVPLRGPLGWGSQARRLEPAEQWGRMSTESMTREVLNVVLPDDAESTGESHPWSEFVTVLADAGLSVTERKLADVPYAVVFAPRLDDVLHGVGIEAATAVPNELQLGR